jgi:hypothetical protein
MAAEKLAAKLSPELSAALKMGRLHVVRRKKGFLRLMENGRRLYSVWDNARRVANLRRACICGSGKALRSCGDHADSAADLVRALAEMHRAEGQFWNYWKDKTCCGRVVGCPLNRSATSTNTAEAA